MVLWAALEYPGFKEDVFLKDVVIWLTSGWFCLTVAGHLYIAYVADSTA